MSLAYWTSLGRSLLALSLLVATAAQAEPPAAAPPPPPKLRIKNARSINVVMGYKKRAPASAIKPDKGVWNVVMTPDLAGAAVEIVDITPDVTRSRWTLAVQTDKVVLDHRFLPTHVYQLDVRKEKKLVGTALVYLYPPPNEDNGKVEFKDEETTAKKEKGDSGPLSSVPKGDL